LILQIDGNIQIPNQTTQNNQIPVHIFTDSMFTQNILFSTNNSNKHFYIIEEIKNYAKKLTNFKFTLHWIPSHIEYTEYGKIPIKGNFKADKLAEIARLQEVDPLTENIDFIRDTLLDSSADLISKIQNILNSTPPISFDSTSSDDFSNSDAIRDLSHKRNFRDI